jgi:O-antigen ligase
MPHIAATPLPPAERPLRADPPPFHQRLLELLSFCILGTFFLLPAAAGVSTALLLVVVVLVAGTAPARAGFVRLFTQGEERWIAWPFLLWLIAAVIVASFSPLPFHKVLPDNPLRFVLALAVLALLVRRPPDARWLLWSLPVAAIAAGAHAIYGVFWAHEWRVKGWTNNEIYFGNMAALVCVLLLVTGLMGRNLRWQVRVLFLLCSLLAAYASVTSGSRSSALALLALIPVLAMRHKDLLHKLFSVLVAATLGVSAALLAASPALQQKLRITEFAVDLQQAQSHHYDTSIGARMEMWRAAWDMFQQHPVVGIGPKRFATELEQRMASGQTARIPRFSQAHSQILHAAATGGVVLVLAYLCLVAGPAVFFWRKLRQTATDPPAHMLAAMGLIIIASHLLFGLTNAVFDLQIYSAVYPMLLCMLAVLLRPGGVAGVSGVNIAARRASP